MSTSWFGIDKEGNVALIDFDENGPVPYGCGEQGLSDLISDEMATIGKDGIRNMNYSIAQANELIKRLKEPTLDMMEFDCIVRISSDKKTEFKSVCMDNAVKEPVTYPYIIICEESGLYKVDMYEWEDTVKQYLLDNNIIIGICAAEIETADSWDEKKEKWEFANEMAGYPYYLYQQPYWTGQLTELTYIPTVPMKADQLDEKIRNNALHFPISFRERPFIQIAEFFQCGSWGEGEVSQDGIRRMQKYSCPASDGGEIIVREQIIGNPDCNICRKCVMPDYPRYKTFSIMQYGLSPTIVELTTPFDIIPPDYNLPPLYEKWLNERSNLQRLINIPIIPGIPIPASPYYFFREDIVKIAEQQNLSEWFGNCRDNFVESVSALFPRAIIATENADKIIKKFFEISGNTIEIAGNAYPYFVMTADSDFINEIGALSRQPYRGVNPRRVVYLENEDESSDECPQG